jgi:hypothetical protein
MSEACEILHRELSELPRYGVGFDPSRIPSSGLSVMFERGERAHGTDRITHIGSHTGRGSTLAKRLEEHYSKENKDRSILRKHIGRCILVARSDPFLEQWDRNLTSRENRERYGAFIDAETLARVEEEVSDFLRENFTFAALAISGARQRIAIKHALLATVASCSECYASANWLGRFHPDGRVQRVGLWNIQGVNRTALNPEEVRALLMKDACSA